MFASPIIYPPSLVPEKFRIFLEINPFFAIIQGMRWAIYGGDAPEASTCAFAAVMTLGLLISALYYFNEVQRSFADRM
jgi:lipopolysaccharide transport system permease protein